jgi:hypothetical protein
MLRLRGSSGCPFVPIASIGPLSFSAFIGNQHLSGCIARIHRCFSRAGVDFLAFIHRKNLLAFKAPWRLDLFMLRTMVNVFAIMGLYVLGFVATIVEVSVCSGVFTGFWGSTKCSEKIHGCSEEIHDVYVVN